jgi:sec-independent protein translocase protein TatC
MAEVDEDSRPEGQEEDGGGPVKSFLDHLEDLRWTLIKSAAAVTVAMIVCLAAGDRLMTVMKRPLQRAANVSPGHHKYLRLYVETNRVWQGRLDTNRIGSLEFGTNQLLAFSVEPKLDGTNWTIKLNPLALPPGEEIISQIPVTLLNLSPAGGFMVAFQLAIYGGILIASPLIIYFVGQFVFPALKMKEKKYVYRGMGIGTGLFLTGVSFCYFVLMPFALNASQRYSQWLGIGADQWTAELYLSFVCKFMLGMGLGFELPVVLLILVKLGILDCDRLRAFRKYMIVINLVLGAVLTTPEVLTQVLMAIPLQILYEITIMIAWYWERKEKKQQAASETGESK